MSFSFCVAPPASSCAFFSVGLRIHRNVDVGSQHQRLTEETHGAVRIELLRLAQGAPGFGMVEVGRQPQPLVEIALRLGTLGADRIGQRAQVLPQWRLGVFIGLHGLFRRHRSGRRRGDQAMTHAEPAARQSRECNGMSRRSLAHISDAETGAHAGGHERGQSRARQVITKLHDNPPWPFSRWSHWCGK